MRICVPDVFNFQFYYFLISNQEGHKSKRDEYESTKLRKEIKRGMISRRNYVKTFGEFHLNDHFKYAFVRNS